jgi:hypothetical protein
VADVSARAGLVEQIRTVSWLRWRVLRNSFRNKSRRLDLIGLMFSGVFSAVFVVAVTIAFFAGTKYVLEQHVAQLFSLFFLALLVWCQLFPIMLAGFFAFRFARCCVSAGSVGVLSDWDGTDWRFRGDCGAGVDAGNACCDAHRRTIAALIC